jgi:hypothetical protein
MPPVVVEQVEGVEVAGPVADVDHLVERNVPLFGGLVAMDVLRFVGTGDVEALGEGEQVARLFRVDQGALDRQEAIAFAEVHGRAPGPRPDARRPRWRR